MLKLRDIPRCRYCLASILLALLMSSLAACAPAASSTPVPTMTPLPQATPVPAVTAPTSATVTIEMINTSFNPATVEVKAGTTVVWVNKDPVEHSTTSDSNLWDSGTMGAGATFSYTFTQPGTYQYYCRPHLALGMTGVITVVP